MTDDLREAVAQALAEKHGLQWACECSEQRGMDCDCGDALTDDRAYPSDTYPCRHDFRLSADAAIQVVVERCAQVCHEKAEMFRSPEYATNQPLSSVAERFACDQCAAEIRALARKEGGE